MSLHFQTLILSLIDFVTVSGSLSIQKYHWTIKDIHYSKRYK